MLVLRDGGNKRQNKEDHVHRENRHDQRSYTHGNLCIGGNKTVTQITNQQVDAINKGREQRQDHAWSNGHEHIV